MRRQTTFKLLPTAALLLVLLPCFALAGPPPPGPTVHPMVWEAIQAEGEAEILVLLREQADISAAYTLPTKEAKGRYVYETLHAVAERTQQDLRALLDEQGVEYQPFFIVNMIKVKADAALVQLLARRTDVDRILPNPWVRGVPDVPAGQEQPGNHAPEAIEGGILRSKADQVWALGYRGAGIVVAGQDTGYDWDHPAIVRQYRGCLDPPACSLVDHDYNWHDAIHSGNGGSCGLDSPVPCDDHGHGTHTMGTIVGDDGGSNQIGMAPEAGWIGCRNMDVGNGTPATYTECFQWFLAPTRVDGSDPDPTKAPHVINNSWSCPPSEGCSWDTLQTVVENVRAAGIVVVVSATNDGSACSTVTDPPAIYEAAFSVGAFNHTNDTIASFSSRGPVTVDGSGRRKPDIAAPGVNIRSALRNSSNYTTMSGTSMAGPHVAGAVALFLNAHNCFIGDVDGVELALESNAEPKTTTQGCGGDGPTDVPNNVWGWGILDALAAFLNPPPADFAIDATPNTLDICAPDDAVYDVDLVGQNCFADAVTLSTSGRPAGTTESWSVNPVVPPGGSVLTIGNTAAATPGSYNIDVIGDAPAGQHIDTVVLNLSDAAPGSATLTTPAEGATDVSTTPAFDWNDVATAATYEIEIASDPGFGTIIDSASGLTSSDYTPGSALDADTVYYWQVRAGNACGAGVDSAIWAFRTEASGCNSYSSSDVPRTIPDPGCVDSTLDVGDSFALADVDVRIDRITHLRDQDLDIYIWHPDTSEVELSTDNGGTGDHYIDTRFDDEAPTPITAGGAPFSGSFQPEGMLSDLDGNGALGAWTLHVCDDSSLGSPGTLEGWGLELCYSGSSLTADYSDLVASYGIAWHVGDGSFRLGNTWTDDSVFPPGFAPGSDDIDGSDDGITFPGSFLAGQPATVRVNVQGTPANGRWLRLWFDWDGNGVFDDYELEYDGALPLDGDNDVVVNVPVDYSAPVYYRARLYDSAGAPLALDPASYGEAAGGEVEDGESPSPTAVRLAWFEASPVPAGVLLTWETEIELNNLGFNLYRSTAPDGLGERLNETLIPSQAPGEGQGAVYTFLDETAESGVTYYYTLEDVDGSGWRTAHGPVVLTLWRAYIPLVWR